MENWNYIIRLFLLASVALMPACMKKCQQPGEPLRTVVGTEFRLVETTDRAVTNLTNTNFNILVLQINYSGAIYDVINNDKYENPKYTIRYNIDPQRKLIRWQLFEPPAEEDGEGAVGAEVGQPQTFRYKLSNQLELTNQADGSYFRFVPFKGVVNPDEVCDFDF